jgi:hypothetical protein
MTKRTRKRGKARGPASAPASAVTLPTTAWDLGASGPANRHGMTTEDAGEINPTTGQRENPNGVIRARRVDMLEVWHRKGVITGQGYYAAIKLRDAIECTQKAPGWPDNDRVQSSPKPDHAIDMHLSRQSDLHEITRHIAADDEPLVWHCVIGGTPASLRIRGVRPYHGGNGLELGLQHLADALDRLAKAMGW